MEIMITSRERARAGPSMFIFKFQLVSTNPLEGCAHDTFILLHTIDAVSQGPSNSQGTRLTPTNFEQFQNTELPARP